MDFLIPYSLVTGSLGGYLGYSIARDIDVIRESKRKTKTDQD